jgi:UDP-galactopyranose mutase
LNALGKSFLLGLPRQLLAEMRDIGLMYDYLIVGAGFSGCVLAERLASQLNKRILLIDKRDHIGGNAYDQYNEHDILIHPYGPHIFHTNSQAIFDYLSLFTEWRSYEHRVLASVDGNLLPIPINRTTVNRLYNLDLKTADECENFYNASAEKILHRRTSEDVVVSRVGRDLYDKFFRGYTRKQWGLDPSELDAQVTARVPARTNSDDRYFTDSFQYMPADGFTSMFTNMLAHRNIDVSLSVDFADLRKTRHGRDIIYTGPIDEYFGYRFGALPYRSLEFKHETLPIAKYQDVAVINYPNDFSYTRVTEFKHLTGQQHPKTSIVYEYPRANGDPYYPVPTRANNSLYSLYKALAELETHVKFVGRLATYKYYNMDQVVGQALATFKTIANYDDVPYLSLTA